MAAAIVLTSLDEIWTSPFSTLLSAASAFTNLIMLMSPWAVFRPRGWGSRALRIAAILSIVVNVAVLWVWPKEAACGPGYYAWVGSFIAVTAAMNLSRRAPAPR